MPEKRVAAMLEPMKRVAKPRRVRDMITCHSSTQAMNTRSGMGTPTTVPCPMAWTKSGTPDTSPPRVRNSPSPRTKIIIDSDTRMGCAPV